MKRYLFILSFLGFSSGLTVFFIAYLNFDHFENYGVFGDFIGGLLNPILMFITFLSLMMSIFLQQEDLNLTRVEVSRTSAALERQLYEMEKQSFEDTLFRMLSNYHRMIFSAQYSDLGLGVISSHKAAYESYSWHYELHAGEQDLQTRLSKAYISFSQSGGIDAYIGIFYFFRILDFCIENKSYKNYIKDVISSLSIYELLMFFYICASFSDKKYVIILSENINYEHFPVGLLLHPTHASFLRCGDI